MFSFFKKKYTLLSLGDSYTIGECVAEKERWPMQAIAQLKKKNIYFKKPTLIAKTGWTTGELLEAIKNKNINSSFDFVSILIGVNNQYRGQSTDVYRKEFTELLQLALQFAKGKKEHVFVISIPDYGVTPFAKDKNPEKIANEINIFNQINYEEAIKDKVGYIEITMDSKKAKEDFTLIAKDELHPSEKMYAAWATKASTYIEKIIQQQS